ncbi:MAG: hypothetical protein VYE22_15115 [Myxococcota bacterium]|nr:hypothetical protein [Myxococcota bacterium]
MRHHGPLLAALLCGLPGCASEAHGDAALPQKAELAREAPFPAPAQLNDVQEVLVDVGVQQACDALRGRMMTLGGEGDGPRTGRLWLNACEARADGEVLELDFGAWAWTWVDERAGAAGATFAVQQYVVLEASTTMRVRPQVRYLRPRRQLLIWMRPEDPPHVTVRPIGDVDAAPQDVWSHVLGGLATVFGSAPDGEARQQVREEGSSRFEDELREGFTIFADLCTGDAGMEMGRLTSYPHPRRRPTRPGPPTRMRIEPGGIDVHGPLREDRGRILVTLRTEDAPVRASLMCRDDAERFIRAFAEGRISPQPSLDDGRATPNAPTSLRAGGDCPLYLVTTPEGEGTAISFTARNLDESAEPIVSGCR